MNRITIVFFCALWSQWLFGTDTVEMKTGERVQGLFKQATAAGVVMEVGGQPITVPIAKVRAIYLGAAPDAAKAGSSATEAIDALKGLQSVTTSGVSYRDYAPRVLDAKIKVDKYLGTVKADDAKSASIRLAMQYYELASAAWGAKITETYSRSKEVGRTLRSDPALRECPSIKAAIADADASAEGITGGSIGLPPQTPAQTADTAVLFTGTNVGANPGLLWSCAASKIAEADKH